MLALEGIANAGMNASAAAGANAVYGAFLESGAGFREFEVVGATSWRNFGLVLQLSRLNWGELGEDLGIDGLTAHEQGLGAAGVFQYGPHALSLGARLQEAEFFGNKTQQWSGLVGSQHSIAGDRVRLGVASALYDYRGDFRALIGTGIAGRVPIGMMTAELGATIECECADQSGSSARLGLQLGYVGSGFGGALRLGTLFGDNPYGTSSLDGKISLGGGLHIGAITADVGVLTGQPWGTEIVIGAGVRW